MNLTSTASTSSASRRLARAVAIVRTEMGHRRPSDNWLTTVRAALRSRRGVHQRIQARQLSGVGGGA